MTSCRFSKLPQSACIFWREYMRGPISDTQEYGSDEAKKAKGDCKPAGGFLLQLLCDFHSWIHAGLRNDHSHVCAALQKVSWPAQKPDVRWPFCSFFVRKNKNPLLYCCRWFENFFELVHFGVSIINWKGGCKKKQLFLVKVDFY